jgi:hypothetical protein
MALNTEKGTARPDLEKQKFGEDSNADTAVRVIGGLTGSSGLELITEMTRLMARQNEALNEICDSLGKLLNHARIITEIGECDGNRTTEV